MRLNNIQYLFFIQSLCLSCNSSEEKPIEEVESEIIQTNIKTSFELPPREIYLNGYHIFFNEQESTANFYMNDSLKYIDTINKALAFFGFETRDLDIDGIPDLQINTADVDASIDYWYVFNSVENKFKKLEGIDWIANPKQLDSASYYYTYDPGGCDGTFWSSQLFKIEQDKIVVLNKIIYDGCSDELQYIPQIYFYKKKGSRLIEITESEEILEEFFKDSIRLEDYWNYQI